jgi:hypothetical protein
VSKQDTKFTNLFSVVISLLITVAILLIALAKVVGANMQGERVKAESLQLAAVDERTRPFARVA